MQASGSGSPPPLSRTQLAPYKDMEKAAHYRLSAGFSPRIPKCCEWRPARQGLARNATQQRAVNPNRARPPDACFIPNRSLDRQEYIFVTFQASKSVIRPPGIYFCYFSGFPSAFALPAASCLPLCPDAARYAFDKGDRQSARQQQGIALASNDRFGLTFLC